MTNLLQETLNDIKKSGHTPEDIRFIGSSITAHSCTWEEFQILADIEYDRSSGIQQIAYDLIIVFKDGNRMSRYDDSGLEGWSYFKPFAEPIKRLPIRSLRAPTPDIGWCNLEAINEELAE